MTKQKERKNEYTHCEQGRVRCTDDTETRTEREGSADICGRSISLGARPESAFWHGKAHSLWLTHTTPHHTHTTHTHTHMLSGSSVPTGPSYLAIPHNSLIQSDICSSALCVCVCMCVCMCVSGSCFSIQHLHLFL